MRTIKFKERTIQIEEELYHFLHTKRYSNRRLWKRFLYNVCNAYIYVEEIDNVCLLTGFNWTESPEGFNFWYKIMQDWERYINKKKREQDINNQYKK